MSTTTSDIASVNNSFFGKTKVSKGYQQNLVKNFYSTPYTKNSIKTSNKIKTYSALKSFK